MSVKINSLVAENVKRVKAVQLEPSEDGLTIIGGNNRQGKTSVLDAIAWALGGNKFKPSKPEREGSVLPPEIHIELSNGLIVERSGKNASLKVIDPNGNRGGQALLDSFIAELALDLPRFMQANAKEKAQTLLKIIGVGDELYSLEQEEKSLYNKRTTIGQIATQKQKYADELPVFPDAPSAPVSVAKLIQEQQAILAQNGENERKRQNKARYARELEEARRAYEAAQERLVEAQENARIAAMEAEELHDESTAEIEESIASIEAINERVRTNQAKARADAEAAEYQTQYDDLTAQIEAVRSAKLALLNGVELPLPGLSVEDGELTYLGQRWDGMSGADQLKVATAIVSKLNPNCGFVLLDKLEQMDMNELAAFGAWLESQGLQVIATRVSTGEECSVIIEDGHNTEQRRAWKAGEF